MNKWQIANAIFFLLFAAFTYSCKTSRLVTAEKKLKKAAPEFLLEKISEQDQSHEWLSARAGVSYDDGDDKQSFTAQIRYRKDSVFWVSISALLGIEVARAIIYDDTIRVIDRINKLYYEKPLSFLERYVPFSIQLALLQDVIAGNMIWMVANDRKSSVDDGQYKLVLSSDEMETHYWIDPSRYLVSRMALKEQRGNRMLLESFNGYKKINNGSFFSFDREIVMKGDQKVLVNISFSRVQVDEALSFPFSVSSSYEKMD